MSQIVGNFFTFSVIGNKARNYEQFSRVLIFAIFIKIREIHENE